MREISEKIRINHEPNSRRLLDPPFYLREFEEAFRYIIDEYHIPPHDIGVFIPCAVRKPYSTSPSHRLFHKILNSVYADTSYHVAIFGTCGTVPAELECMYPPYAQYHYMLGKCTNQRIKDDFLKIETYRLTEFLEKPPTPISCGLPTASVRFGGRWPGPPPKPAQTFLFIPPIR